MLSNRIEVENSADEQGPNSYIIPDRYILRTKRVVSPQPKILDGWDGVSILDRKFFLYESEDSLCNELLEIHGYIIPWDIPIDMCTNGYPLHSMT